MPQYCRAAEHHRKAFAVAGANGVGMFTCDATMKMMKRATYTRDAKPLQRNGKWVCSLHTEALMGDAFGRDRNVQ